MRPSEDLQHDHDVVRAKLTLLDTWLSDFPTHTYLLHHMTDSIVRLLQSHQGKEELLCSALWGRLSASSHAIVRQFDKTHHEQLERLRTLTCALEDRALSPHERLDAHRLIVALRSQMAREEAALFPQVDGASDAIRAARHERLSELELLAEASD